MKTASTTTAQLTDDLGAPTLHGSFQPVALRIDRDTDTGEVLIEWTHTGRTDEDGELISGFLTVPEGDLLDLLASRGIGAEC